MHEASLGTSFLLIAAGAILRWAVTVDVEGFDIQVAGLVLLFVGILTLLVWLLLWSSSWWGWGPGRGPGRRDETRVDWRDRP